MLVNTGYPGTPRNLRNNGLFAVHQRRAHYSADELRPDDGNGFQAFALLELASGK